MAKSNILIKSKLKKARSLVSQQNLIEAKTLYTQLYRKNKSMHGIGLELAVVHRKLGEFKETESICKNIISISPNNAYAHHVYGSALQCMNQFDDAIEEYKTAIKLDKSLTETHYFLGNIYQLTGNPEAAAKSYYRAIDLNPDFYEALNNLGATLIELNRPIDAKHIIDKAIRINPNSIQLLCNIAGFYFLDNNLDKALVYAKRAYDIDPDFVDALQILGKIYYQKSDYDEALGYYKKAYSLSGDVKLTAHIAQILERRSEYCEASKLITALIESGNTDVATLLTYSALSRKFDNQPEAIELIEKSIDTINYDDASLISLHSELGKQYDSLKIFNNAFKNYKKANLIERKLNKQFEILNDIKEMDNTKAEDIAQWHNDYNKSFWESLLSSGNESTRSVFIVGMFRSGTTLCEQILSSHPEVYGAGELPDINAISYSLNPTKTHDKSPASLKQVTQDQLSAAAASYLETLNCHSTKATRVVDKMPANFIHVGLISRLFPNAHIVHMKRDPRDTCLSMYFQRFGPQMTMTTDLVELADYYLAYQSAMSYWHDVLDIKIHDVVYEDLVADQERVTRELLEYCELGWDDRCLNFHQTKRDVNTPSYDQVRKPLYKKSAARWKNYREQLKPLTDRLGLDE